MKNQLIVHGAPNPHMTRIWNELLSKVSDLPTPHVSSMNDGGGKFTWVHDACYVEIKVYHDGKIYWYFNNRGYFARVRESSGHEIESGNSYDGLIPYLELVVISSIMES